MICRVSKEFPAYRVAVESGHVVKFIGYKAGQVIKDSRTRPVGYCSETWVDFRTTDVWRKLTDAEMLEVGGLVDFEFCCRLKG
jgi:hypothetical protein